MSVVGFAARALIAGALIAGWMASAGCWQSSTSPDGDVGDLPAEETEFRGDPPVDILVLVDYSGSMGQEQVALTSRFPLLLDALVHPPDDDSDGVPDFPPVTDIHLGVVTQDLGAGGFPVTTCDDEPFVGDDGCLHHTPYPGARCSPEYPRWLDWRVVDEDDSIERLAEDFACIGNIPDVGPAVGCGWEQPLEALRRALTTQAAVGACNEGFLRPDSLLVLIVLTDENDMSVDPDRLDMLDPEREDLGHLNIRAFLHPEMLTPVEDFVAAFRALRPEGSDRLVVGLLVGVPPGPACEGLGDELEGCLSLPEMEERLDPDHPTGLVTSCDTSMGIAVPPVRLVQLAQQLGEDAVVGSLCVVDYSETIRRIAGMVGDRLVLPPAR